MTTMMGYRILKVPAERVGKKPFKWLHLFLFIGLHSQSAVWAGGDDLSGYLNLNFMTRELIEGSVLQFLDPESAGNLAQANHFLYGAVEKGRAQCDSLVIPKKYTHSWRRLLNRYLPKQFNRTAHQNLRLMSLDCSLIAIDQEGYEKAPFLVSALNSVTLEWQLQTLAAEFPNLRSLSMSQVSHPGAQYHSLGDLPELKELTLSQASGKTFEDLIPYIPKVQKLQLIDVPQVEWDQGISSSLKKLKDLKELKLQNIAGLDSLGSKLEGISRDLVALESLSFTSDVSESSDYKKQFSDQGLKALKSLSKLVELKIESSLLTPSGLTYLKFLVSLRRLSLPRTSIGDFEWNQLTDLPPLEELEFLADGLTDRGLKKVSQISSLKKLILHQAEVVTVEGILEALNSLKALQFLEIYSYSLPLTDRQKLQLSLSGRRITVVIRRGLLSF